MERLFELSVIMPIYNTEKYLKEAIESVINQTMDFEKNIQLILLDDASGDESVSIAKEYLLKYPNNILLITFEEHVGVGALRNRGLELATGKYITFLDSDDKWSLNAFEEALLFFEDSDDEIDLISVNCEMFDAIKGPHAFNFYRDKNSIIDINIEYDKIRTMIPCFIKSEVAKLYRFNEEQIIREDAVFTNRIILRRQRYGMLSKKVNYYYRRRCENNSAMNTYLQRSEYFWNEPYNFFDGLYSESLKQAGKFLPMMQILASYDIVVRCAESLWLFNVLQENEELLSYFSNLRKNLLLIDKEYILEAPYNNQLIKSLLVAYKYDENIGRCFLELRNKNRGITGLNKKLERTSENWKLLKRIMRLDGQNISIAEIIRKKGYENIAIYGFAEVGVWLYKELKKSGIIAKYAIDRRANSMQEEITVISAEDRFPEVDVIVVTAVNAFQEIREMLLEKVGCAIININDLLSKIEEYQGLQEGEN